MHPFLGAGVRATVARRKRVHHADNMMARITPERRVQHLEASGFVVMKGQAARAPTTANMPPAVE